MFFLKKKPFGYQDYLYYLDYLFLPGNFFSNVLITTLPALPALPDYFSPKTLDSVPQDWPYLSGLVVLGPRLHSVAHLFPPAFTHKNFNSAVHLFFSCSHPKKLDVQDAMGSTFLEYIFSLNVFASCFHFVFCIDPKSGDILEHFVLWKSGHCCHHDGFLRHFDPCQPSHVCCH